MRRDRGEILLCLWFSSVQHFIHILLLYCSQAPLCFNSVSSTTFREFSVCVCVCVLEYVCLCVCVPVVVYMQFYLSV